jgi:hypothetical protein
VSEIDNLIYAVSAIGFMIIQARMKGEMKREKERRNKGGLLLIFLSFLL